MNSKLTLFLDIDGTLSNIGDVSKDFSVFQLSRSRIINGYFHVEHRRERYLSLMALVSTYNLEEFHMLCRVLGYDNIDKIVISSTWRYGIDLQRIARVLYLKGMDYELVSKIKDKTKILKKADMPYTSGNDLSSSYYRAAEIEDYIKEHELIRDNCIVLDDIPLGEKLGDMYYDFCDYVKGFEYNGVREKWILN